MKHIIFILLLSLIFDWQTVSAQSKPNSNYYSVGGFADLTSDFIYLHYARVGFQHYLGNRFSVQASLKVGSRSGIEWIIPSYHDGEPINWINWHSDTPSGNPFIFENTESQPKKLGISSYQINDESVFYSSVAVSAGWRVPIFFKGYLESLIGLGLRYTDNHYIGESGDGIFVYEGTEYQIYYLVPVYQRGIDGHFNFELNLTFPVSKKLSFRPGFITDFTFGSSEVGVGNYYSAGASLLVKL